MPQYILMNSRLQFLLRSNAGKRYLDEYKEIVSKLIQNSDYDIMNLEESDTI